MIFNTSLLSNTARFWTLNYPYTHSIKDIQHESAIKYLWASYMMISLFVCFTCLSSLMLYPKLTRQALNSLGSRRRVLFLSKWLKETRNSFIWSSLIPLESLVKIWKCIYNRNTCTPVNLQANLSMPKFRQNISTIKSLTWFSTSFIFLAIAVRSCSHPTRRVYKVTKNLYTCS